MPPFRALILSFAVFQASLVPALAQTSPTPMPVTASTPRVIRLEGGVAVDAASPGSVEAMTLAIYASSSDATPLWQETQQVAIDAGGRYVVYLGATVPDGLPVDVLSGSEVRWLGVRVERPGATEQPRTPLTSVPYAVRAAAADTLGGLPPSAFVRVGEAGPGGNGANAAEPVRATAPAVNSGTINYLGKFTSTIDLGNSVVFENSGRIGVGTTQPFDILHSRFTNNDGGLTGFAVQNLGSSAASYSGMLFYDQNGSLGQFQGFNNSTHEYRINNVSAGGTINFMTNSTSRFRVRNDGDIEISGNLRKNGVVFVHDLGGVSVGVGGTALANGASSAQNVAVGYGALNTTTGNGNVAVGWAAGASKTGGDFNIYIGAGVGFGAGTESNTMRLGDGGGISRTFVGGVRNVTTLSANAVNVMIDSTGNLGTVNSSRRYKRDIQDMGEASSGLMRLRPVTYRYTQPYADGSMPVDYGLIAEEVEEVYPDLVAHLKDGEVETVQYHKINAMLLNEVQKQHREIEAQRAEMAALTARLALLERRLSSGGK